MPIASINGIRVYHEAAGKGAPLVLVHGFACGIRSWDPQARGLSRSRLVITYDVRGHGISEAPPEPTAYSQPASVEDLRALLVHLGIRRAAVGGLSMGGNIALNFALAHPDMVTQLVVADTGAGSDDTADWIATVHDFAETLDRRGMEAFADLACANPLFARYIAQGPSAERFIRSCLMTHRAHGIAHTAREVLAKRPPIYALESRLRQLEVPTLLIVGEDDAPCVKVHRFMADCLRRSTHIVLRGRGHLTNLEAPAAFNAAIRRFVGS
ncbi:MAG TPA: alpha/beta fold hydrolase [Candidatus Methylomirabilis sp.]|nr:alpha/beta fold hydrolase [Candidatus Methylomirabilis sp.]